MLLFVLLGVGGVFVLGLIAVGLLVALLLPAVQGAREAARRNAEKAHAGEPRAAETAGDRWQEHTSTAGRYRVSMPGTPIQRTQPQLTPLGPVTIQMSILETPTGVYLVTYYSMAGGDPDLILEGVAEGSMQAINGRLTSKRNISLDGHPGRELEFTGTQGGTDLEGRSRIYLVDDRLYQVMWMGNPNQRPEADIARFFDSFEITSTAGESRPVADATADAGAENETSSLVDDRPTVDERPEPIPSVASDGQYRHREFQREALHRRVGQIERHYRTMMDQAGNMRGYGIEGGARNLEAVAERTREDAYQALAASSNMTVEELKEIARELDD